MMGSFVWQREPVYTVGHGSALKLPTIGQQLLTFQNKVPQCTTVAPGTFQDSLLNVVS